jgi:DNA primase
VAGSGVLDHFYSQQLCRIGRMMVQADPAPDAFVTRIMTRMETDADRELIASLAMTDGMDDNTDLKDAAAAIIQRIIRIRKKKDSGLTEKIKRAEKSCDTDLMELLKLKQQEIRQLHNGQ